MRLADEQARISAEPGGSPPVSQGGGAAARESEEFRLCWEALRRSEERFEHLCRYAAEWVWEVDAQGLYTFASPAVERLLGYQPDELVGRRHFYDLFPELTRDDLKAEALAAFEARLPLERLTNVCQHKAGHLVMLETSGGPMLSADGALLGYRGLDIDVTERDRALAELRESEERYRSVLHTAESGFWLVDPGGWLLDVNDSYCRMSGYERDELLAMHVSELVLGSAAQDVTQRIVEIRAAERLTFPSRHKRRDGTWYRTEASVTALPGGQALAGFIRDVTERELAAERLSRLNRELAAHTECAQAVVRALDEASLIAEVCRLICELVGYPLAWVGLAADDDRRAVWIAGAAGAASAYADTLDVTWDDSEPGRGPVGTCIRTAVPCYVEDFAASPWTLPWRAAAARHQLASCLALPLREPAATPEGGQSPAFGALAIYATEACAFTDEEIRLLGELADDLAFGIVSLRSRAERARAEAQVRESEQLYQSLVDRLPQAVTRQDCDGVYVFANQRFCELLGRPLEEVLGATDADVFGQRAVGQAGEPVETVEELDLPVVGRRTLSISRIPLLDARGEPAGVQAIYTDITEQVRLEARYRQAQRLQSIGRLAGGVAHDFNNLLQPIMGYTDMLLAELPQDSVEAADLREIRRASERGRALTRQLLAFGGRQVLDLKAVDLGEIARHFWKLLRRTIREDIVLDLRCSPSLAAVHADTGQIEQVLMNLAVNAQHAMPAGGAVLVSLVNETVDEAQARSVVGLEPGEWVVLSVLDTGCGMDAETQARVFEPFFTTRSQGEGTGLGLATVYGIVRQHGGAIELRSQPGLGSEFRIYLPAVDEVGATGEPSSPDPRRGPRGSETVVVVDDDDQVRALTCRVLEAQGYRVSSASRGADGLALLRSLAADVQLLVTDVVMPGMHGRELFERAQADVPGLRVLYMSGHTNDVLATRGIAGDSRQRLLQKPFDTAVLLQSVRAMLDA